MNTQKEIKSCNDIALKLANLIDEVKSGSLSISKANSINKLALTSIKATKEGVMMLSHHQIQQGKIDARNRRTEAINKVTEFKLKKLGYEKNSN